jgi:hypothetical protein
MAKELTPGQWVLKHIPAIARARMDSCVGDREEQEWPKVKNCIWHAVCELDLIVEGERRDEPPIAVGRDKKILMNYLSKCNTLGFGEYIPSDIRHLF